MPTTAKPMRRWHYLYGRTTWLTDPAVFAELHKIHRRCAIDQARSLGLLDPNGAVVAISTWLAQPDGTQVRGMATEPALAGSGLGSILVAAGVERCRARGDRVVWANARVGALGFYERAGFTVDGAVFETAATGLPHQTVRQILG